jgi:hypothetical protein
MIRTSLAALAFATLAAAPALAAEHTPLEIVHRHMAFGAAGKYDAMANDYAPDGVILTADKATRGRAAIREMFKAMVGPGSKPPNIKPIKVWSEGDVGFVSWEMNPGSPKAVKGNDSFLVHHGKIVAQAVFIGEPPPS